MHKSAFLFLVVFCGPFVLSFISSCDKGGRCGSGEYNAKDICVQVDSLHIGARYASDDNGRDLDANAHIRATNLVLVTTFYGPDVVCVRPRTDNSFVTTAYACSPVLPDYVVKDHIIEMTITSNEDFDAEYPAGSNLNAYFNLPALTDVNSNEFSDYTASNEIAEHRARLQQAPAKEGLHTFTISYKMNSGRVVHSTARPLYLTK